LNNDYSVGQARRSGQGKTPSVRALGAFSKQ
jgi:hypothetical protein